MFCRSPKDRPQLAFNRYDEECKVNRKSHMGKYEVVDRLPRYGISNHINFIVFIVLFLLFLPHSKWKPLFIVT